MPRHHGEWRISNSMWRELHCQRMTNDAYATVHDCLSCRGNRRKPRRKRKLHLFPGARILEFAAIDILGSLWKKSNRIIVVMTDRFLRLTKDTPTTKTTAAAVTTIFINDWRANFSIPSKYHDWQVPAAHVRVFQAIYKNVEVKQLTTMENYFQAKGQIKRSNANIVSRLCSYIAKHLKGWDSNVVPLTNAYRTQRHRTTKLPPFRLVLSWQPAGPVTPTSSPMPPDGEHIDPGMLLQIRLMRPAARLKRIVDKNLRRA